MFMFKVSMCKWYCGPIVLFARSIYFVSILFLEVYTYTVYTLGYLILRVLFTRPGIFFKTMSRISEPQPQTTFVHTEMNVIHGWYQATLCHGKIPQCHTSQFPTVSNNMHRLIRWEWHFHHVLYRDLVWCKVIDFIKMN